MSNLNKTVLLTRLLSRRVATASGNCVTAPSTVCPKETEFFKSQAHSWWDANSSIKLLRSMIPVRVDLLTKCLSDAGLVDLDEVHPAKPLENINILEVGCGGGFLAEALTKLGAQVTGIDSNKELIHVAQEHMMIDTGLQDKLEYKHVMVEDFAHQNEEKFDVVVSSEVIEHVADKEVFVRNALKCLRAGGSAFFTTMNRTPVSGFYYIYLCEDVMKIIPKGTHEYCKFMRPKEMTDLFRKYNCITTSVEGFTLNPFNGTWFRIGFPHFNFALHAIKQTKMH